MSSWQPYNRGLSIGKKGSKGNKIVRDEEHPLGAYNHQAGVNPPLYSISGKIDHIRFFKEMIVAKREYSTMKKELVKVIHAVSTAKAADIKVWEAISGFVAQFS